MKNYLVLFLTITLLSSCSKEKRITSILEDNWWEVSCVDISGPITIEGRMDYGKFYFHNNGTYYRNTDSLELKYCSSGENIPYIFRIIPFGEITNGTKDTRWSAKGNVFTINQWGNWEIIDYDNERITFKSSRTNYKYKYTLVRK